MGKLVKTCELSYEFFLIYFLFNYIITKIDDCEIKHQPNTEMFFLDYDNLIKGKTKPIMKLNFQLI
jgi:hypothetical protein